MHTSTHAAPATPGEVHVWQGRSPVRPDAGDLRLLSPAERERLARYRDAGAAARYAASHAALRTVLGRYLGRRPAQVGLGRAPCPLCRNEEHGPPVLVREGNGLTFSLSRSGPYWLLAVAAGHPVGADVERQRTVGRAALERAAFSERERDLLETGSEDVRTRALLRGWTRKEAVLKGAGAGVGYGLRRVETPAHGPALVRLDVPGPTGRWWRVRSLPGGPGGPDLHTALAVPAETPVGPVVRRTFSRPWSAARPAPC